MSIKLIQAIMSNHSIRTRPLGPDRIQAEDVHSVEHNGKFKMRRQWVDCTQWKLTHIRNWLGY